MIHNFYDVKSKKKVSAEVTGKTSYGKGTRIRFAFKAVTKYGRSLTAFVKTEDFDKCTAPVIKAAKKK